MESQNTPMNSSNSPIHQAPAAQNAPAPQDHKRRRQTIAIVLMVIAIIMLGALIRGLRKQNGGTIFSRNNTENNSTNSTNSTNTSNNTNTSNGTGNGTQNTTNTSGGNNGGNNGGGNTSDKSKYPAGKSNISISYGGQTRTAIIYVPKSYSPTNPFPLVVNLHGSESDAEGQENNSHMDITAENNNFIVVYPNGINKEWNDGRPYTKDSTGNADDVGFIKELVKTISDGMNINTNKVYAVGMSNGGMMSHRLACEASSTFAAAGDVAGAMTTSTRSSCSPSRKVPMIIIHGTSDPLVPFDGGDLNSGRGSVTSTLDAVHFWASANGASTTPTATIEINIVSDGTTITRQNFGPRVVFYQVNNGGHTWPGGLQYLRPIVIGLVSKDIDASQQIWNFLRDFSL